ncbi:hypothetical protein AB0K00_36235 [Dactylosporangium sp. NPDC049525]|uniref:hypothetical protein n=1 Tax=Dactylosporangium sp. NPDC049525 TaxID=3154730 RepID=UPI0034142D2B
MSHSKDVAAGHSKNVSAGHSKNFGAGHSKNFGTGHSKDLATVLTPQEQEELVRDVVVTWGQVEVATLRDAPVAALAGLATRAVMALADGKVLTVDQSAELQGRIQALQALAAPAEFSMHVTDALPTTVYEALSSSLPDASLVTSWNVLLTAVVGSAAVLGATLAGTAGADVAAAHIMVVWPSWLAPL